MKMELRRRAIDKLYRRRDRIEMPDFQREEVWTDSKKRLLMDTILRGWHLPKLYFRKVDETSFECVDGQQRLTAIWEFYDNKLTLSDETAKKYGGRLYNELPDAVVDDIDDFELDVEEIKDADDGELEELFQRLQLGTPLNTPERLNAITGEMRDFVKRVAQHEFFKNTIAVKDTRFAHFDIAAKWVFVEVMGIQAQLRFPQLEALFKNNRTFDTKSEAARIINNALGYLERSLPERCTWLRNRANVLSVCMLASATTRRKLDKTSEKQFGHFVSTYFQDLAREVEKGARSTERELLDYQQAISYGSTGGDSIRKRLNILARRLATFDTTFAGLLNGPTETVAMSDTGIPAEAETIRDLIHAVNEKYAAIHGNDLFKSTNATTAALSVLGKIASNDAGYKELIDALYKLFYEGSGTCARLPAPPPEFVMDVKHLRTSIRHDVDHGEMNKSAAKRKHIGEIFQKYSGQRTMEECKEVDFIVAHLRLLKEARALLISL
jgi:hypothetical protein